MFGYEKVGLEQELPQPDQNRLSVLTALVLLTYALLRVVVLPSLATEFSALGLIIRLEVNTRIVFLSLAAALTAAGADWLIGTHPSRKPDESTVVHWVIPGLAALGVGAILARLPEGPTWWLGLGLAAILLIVVLATEFVVLDADDPRYDGAAIGLTALAYLLLVGALFAIRDAGLRATFSVPLTLLACSAVAWRLLRLHHRYESVNGYALLIGIIMAQLDWGLHYWPLRPLRVALMLGLGVYLGTGLTLAHLRNEMDRVTGIEFGTVAAIALTGILALS